MPWTLARGYVQDSAVITATESVHSSHVLVARLQPGRGRHTEVPPPMISNCCRFCVDHSTVAKVTQNVRCAVASDG